jgi:hypothetical protein
MHRESAAHVRRLHALARVFVQEHAPGAPVDGRHGFDGHDQCPPAEQPAGDGQRGRAPGILRKQDVLDDADAATRPVYGEAVTVAKRRRKIARLRILGRGGHAGAA